MKKIWKLLAVLVVSVLMSVCVYAQQDAIFLENYTADGSGAINVICSDMDDKNVEKDGFSLLLDGKEMPIIKVSSVADEKIPITIYCLVDVSGSMKQDQMQQAKDILNTLCDGLGNNDNMVITKLGNQTDTSGFLTDKDKIKETIEQLEPGHDDTNLYSGIVESVNILNKSDGVNPRRCLVILSDGDDDQKSGITREEAERAAKDAKLSIYTVATLPTNPSEKNVETGKILGSFARISPAGVHYAPSIDGIKAQDAASDILGHIKSGIVLNAGLTEEMSASEKMEMHMVYTREESGKCEDTLLINGKELFDAASGQVQTGDAAAADNQIDAVPNNGSVSVQETQQTQSTSSEQTDEEETDGVRSFITSENGWIYIALGAVVLVIAAAVIIVLVNKRKKKAESSAPQTVSMSSSTAAPPLANPHSVEQLEPKPAKVHQVTLMAVGYNNIEHRLELPEGREVTIGRNSKAEITLDTSDKKLSGTHCAMEWKNQIIYVRDLGSTNGTYVNGVPVNKVGRVAVHPGETITIGSYEYRIR